MIGRGGSWVGNTVAGLTLGRVWLYQDFVAGSGPNITLSANDNGTGLSFDSAKIVDGSAVASKNTGEPIFSNAAELPSQIVKMSSHSGTAVVLNATPAVGEGVLRVWYLYVMALSDMPLDAEAAPRFVKEERNEFLDTRFLNADLNLSDLTSASTARTSLGLGTAAIHDVAFFAQTANNLSDLIDAAAARSNLGLGSAATHPASDFEVPLTFSTGLTRTTNTITVNASQSISTLSNLTTNGFVKTSGGTGALSIDTATYQVGALSGDVSAVISTGVTTIGANKVTLAMMATMATANFLGRTTASTGNVESLTATQATAMLNAMTGGGSTGLKGLVPAQAAGDVTKFLRGDATFVDIPATRAKAGKVTLASGINSKAIAFATARADALYTPVAFLVNTVDTDPIHVPCLTIAIATTGFTAEWSDLTPTANYLLYWAILEHYDP